MKRKRSPTVLPPKKRRKIEKTIENYVRNELPTIINDDDDDRYLVTGFFKREMKRHKHIFSSFINASNEEINNLTERFCESRNVVYTIYYDNVLKYITPQYLHYVGLFSFDSGSSTTITVGCEFFGKFAKKMFNTIELLGKSKRMKLDIRFNKEYFNSILPMFWTVSQKRISSTEYSVYLYQDVDNNLYFQLTSRKGHLLGKLNPLERKLGANFFGDPIQVSNEDIEKLSKLKFK